MTATGRQIERLISLSVSDWTVSAGEQSSVIGLLRADANVDATVQYLRNADRFDDLLDRVGIRFEELMQALGGQVNASTAALIRPEIARRANGLPYYAPQYRRMTGGSYLDLFDISHQLQRSLRSHGVATPAAPVQAGLASRIANMVNAAGPSGPFTGMGATGAAPWQQRIPVVDQGLMALDEFAERVGLEDTADALGLGRLRARYENPLASDPAYLSRLTTHQLRDQARILIARPIFSVLPHSYSGDLPSRGSVFAAAAARHSLEPELVAAFVLAEQRDQSMYEDAAEFGASISPIVHNGSIGLGQVIVSTARSHDLFADLLFPATRQDLTHRQIAYLLASDEFNIFATARYIRLVANSAPIDPATIPNTMSVFPNTDLRRYQFHSQHWPADNIRVLGSEYTSRAWDDILYNWAFVVYASYLDVRASGSSF